MNKIFQNRVRIILLLLTIFLTTSCNRPDKGYWENGNLKFILNKKGGHYNGVSTWFYSDGVKQHECYYVNDTLQGSSTRWYANGNLNSVENYKDNQLHGKVTEYDIDGKLASEVNYEHGMLQGTFREYYPMGQIKIEGSYINGKFNGKWIYYDQEGTITGMGEFKEGSGRQRAWYEDGTLKRVVPYVDNEKHGVETWYAPDGKIEKTLVYNLGLLESSENLPQK